ncbi:MAG TPA: minichromosome maintenance protein MCM, partial [Thermoplasmata archaeon]|nr:minichromosome maintenance protein MCM [Thermoplasmata archaeon]
LIRSFRGDPTIVDKVVLSLAPTIRGMEEEKEAIALQLFGGVEKRHPDGIRVRGDIHVLLVGDPGTAKSQLLRNVAEVAPRGIYTSGKGATAAGLTAAAVKDDFGGGRWMLEAGMLVLADGGIAVVDELDKMTPEDRSAMHEALEQQTVSIAKAGITATLNARCPVLAAANPKWGRFTPERTIAEQIDLPPTLLSRFDVIYSIQDRPEEGRDRFLANRILLSHQEGEAREASFGYAPSVASGGAPFSPDLLKKYIAYARRNIRPVLSADALRTLEDFYVRVRKQGEEPDSPVPITARQLEALVRLSEAAARARLSDVVSVEDAERSTRIVEGFLKRVSTTDGKLDIDLVSTGVSHSQRERVELLHEIMRELGGEKGGTFSLDELKAEAERRGIPTGRTDALFHSLRNQGEVLEERPGRWKLVRF